MAGGSGYTGKPRPSVIVQSDLYGGLLSVVICPFTSEIEDVITVRPLVAPNPFNGLAAPSRVMVDKVGAVPAARLGRQLGRLGDEDIARIDQALLAFLGLAG